MLGTVIASHSTTKAAVAHVVADETCAEKSFATMNVAASSRKPERTNNAVRTRPGRLTELRKLGIVFRLRFDAGDARKRGQAWRRVHDLYPSLRILPYEQRRSRRTERAHESRVRVELRRERLGNVCRRDAAVEVRAIVTQLVLAHGSDAVMRLHDRRRATRGARLLISDRDEANLQPCFLVRLQRLPRQVAIKAVRVEEDVQDTSCFPRAFDNDIAFREPHETRPILALDRIVADGKCFVRDSASESCGESREKPPLRRARATGSHAAFNSPAHRGSRENRRPSSLPARA